jgi:hypothetical protein
MMPPLPGVLTPLGLALWLVWNFAVLSSTQLAVRLILAYSPTRTLLASLLFTLGTIPLLLLFAHPLHSQLGWYPILAVVTGVLGYLIAEYVLRLRRLRACLVTAAGTALLSGPWPVFLEALPK